MMAAPGLYFMFRKDRPVAVMTISGVILILLQVGAFYSWFGGNAVGPRYLAPAIPFIGLAAAYAMERWPEPALVLTTISIVMMMLVTAIAIDPPGDVLTPMQSFYFVRLRNYRFAENLGTLLGLPIVASLVIPLIFPIAAAWRWLKEPAAGA